MQPGQTHGSVQFYQERSKRTSIGDCQSEQDLLNVEEYVVCVFQNQARSSVIAANRFHFGHVDETEPDLEIRFRELYTHAVAHGRFA